MKNALTAWGFVYTLPELNMLGLAIGEVLGLRRPYNGVRLGFMVYKSIHPSTGRWKLFLRSTTKVAFLSIVKMIKFNPRSRYNCFILIVFHDLFELENKYLVS